MGKMNRFFTHLVPSPKSIITKSTVDGSEVLRAPVFVMVNTPIISREKSTMSSGCLGFLNHQPSPSELPAEVLRSPVVAHLFAKEGRPFDEPSPPPL